MNALLYPCSFMRKYPITEKILRLERSDLRNVKLTRNLWIKFSICLILFIFLVGSVNFPMIFTRYLLQISHLTFERQFIVVQV